MDETRSIARGVVRILHRRCRNFKKESWNAAKGFEHETSHSQALANFSAQPSRPCPLSTPSTHQIICILFLLLLRNSHIYFFFPKKLGCQLTPLAPMSLRPCRLHVFLKLIAWIQSGQYWRTYLMGSQWMIRTCLN